MLVLVRSSHLQEFSITEQAFHKMTSVEAAVASIFGVRSVPWHYVSLQLLLRFDFISLTRGARTENTYQEQLLSHTKTRERIIIIDDDERAKRCYTSVYIYSDDDSAFDISKMVSIAIASGKA